MRNLSPWPQEPQLGTEQSSEGLQRSPHNSWAWASLCTLPAGQRPTTPQPTVQRGISNEDEVPCREVWRLCQLGALPQEVASLGRDRGGTASTENRPPSTCEAWSLWLPWALPFSLPRSCPLLSHSSFQVNLMLWLCPLRGGKGSANP